MKKLYRETLADTNQSLQPKNTMIQLAYVSSTRGLLNADDIANILIASREKNESRGITGMLLYKGGMPVIGADVIVHLGRHRRWFGPWACAAGPAADTTTDALTSRPKRPASAARTSEATRIPPASADANRDLERSVASHRESRTAPATLGAARQSG